MKDFNENYFDIDRLSANVDSGDLSVRILYNTAPDDTFPVDESFVATVPIINSGADEINWDISKAKYSQYAPAWMDKFESQVMAAIPGIIAKSDLRW